MPAPLHVQLSDQAPPPANSHHVIMAAMTLLLPLLVLLVGEEMRSDKVVTHSMDVRVLDAD